jgi:hypothetical protein
MRRENARSRQLALPSFYTCSRPGSSLLLAVLGDAYSAATFQIHYAAWRKIHALALILRATGVEARRLGTGYQVHGEHVWRKRQDESGCGRQKKQRSRVSGPKHDEPPEQSPSLQFWCCRHGKVGRRSRHKSSVSYRCAANRAVVHLCSWRAAAMHAWRQASRSLRQAAAKFTLAQGYFARHASRQARPGVKSKSKANRLGTTDSMKVATANKTTNDRARLDRNIGEPPGKVANAAVAVPQSQ